MAPRRDTPPRRDNRNSDGVRNRELLNAHTGAGVNANRPAAIRGRGGGSSSRPRGTSGRGALGNQRGRQRRSPVSTPGRRIAERLNSDGNQCRRVQEASSSNNNNAEPQAQQNRSEQRPAANLSTQERSVSILQRHPRSSLPMKPYPITHAQQTRSKQHISLLNVSTPETQARQTPRPRPRSTTYNSFLRASTAPNLTSLSDPSSSSLSLPPSPAAEPTRQRNDAAAARRAFSNPNLRAIMSGKKYPRERKKAAAERPVLKQDMNKEYK